MATPPTLTRYFSHYVLRVSCTGDDPHGVYCLAADVDALLHEKDALIAAYVAYGAQDGIDDSARADTAERALADALLKVVALEAKWCARLLKEVGAVPWPDLGPGVRTPVAEFVEDLTGLRLPPEQEKV